MKKLINVLLLILPILCLLSCGLDEDKNIVNTGNQRDSVVVELSNNMKFYKVSFYNSGGFNVTRTFNYSADSVIMTDKDNANKVLSKTKFFLNSHGVADSVKQYSASGENTSIVTYHNIFDVNGYKIRRTASKVIRLKASGQLIKTADIVTEYEIANGNIVSMGNVSDTISQKYTHYEMINKADIDNYLGDYDGHRNVNLIKTNEYEYSVLTSTIPAKRWYEYTSNSEGFVVERIMSAIPSYRQTDDKPAISKTITSFRYIFR